MPTSLLDSRRPLEFYHATQSVLKQYQPRGQSAPPSLFALTAQSNITNSKNPHSLIQYAYECGYCTILDGAALAPTSSFSIEDMPVDAVAISFYKMFGFPTGVGALIAKESFLAYLQRPWFAGGTVDVVQAPGPIMTYTSVMNERFEVSLCLIPMPLHCVNLECMLST